MWVVRWWGVRSCGKNGYFRTLTADTTQRSTTRNLFFFFPCFGAANLSLLVLFPYFSFLSILNTKILGRLSDLVLCFVLAVLLLFLFNLGWLSDLLAFVLRLRLMILIYASVRFTATLGPHLKFRPYNLYD